MTHTGQKQLDALSMHLRQRRDDLLRAWREAVVRDPELTTNTRLSRTALDDHIPQILADFEHRLRAEHALDAAQVDLQQRRDAAEHGAHRWQQGYDIRETMREWGHLQHILLRELDTYAAAHPELEPGVMPAAREALASLCIEGNCESASRHARLQQAEAASRVRELETSLSALQALENERAMLLRETAHDLRGSVGVIANTTALLAKPYVDGPQRDRFHDLLQQRIHSMGELLANLAELARLEAGQDPLETEPFDAAERVREICEAVRPLATQRGLFLKCEGPAPLPVEGDPVKLQRIIQNLLLNALKATERGEIVARWATAPEGGAQRWTLSIEDTGAGFDARTVSPLRHALKRATEKAHDAAAGARRAAPQPSKSPSRPSAPPSGEGIGLAIVKRLCDLLGATVELETAPGCGTTVRITFPCRYR